MKNFLRDFIVVFLALFISFLLLFALPSFSQDKQDFVRTKPVGNQNVIDGRLKVKYSLSIPTGCPFSLNGAKDSVGYIMYNTCINKLGIYVGSGVWDTVGATGFSIETDPVFNAQKASPGGVASLDLTGKIPTSQLNPETDPVYNSEKGNPNGVATLNSSGKIPNNQIPALALTEPFVVGSESAMLSLTSAEQGDVAIRTDLNKSFILSNNSPGTVGSWIELLTPLIPVESDPIYNASPASSITSPNITNWMTAYSWGNHSGLYVQKTGDTMSGQLTANAGISIQGGGLTSIAGAEILGTGVATKLRSSTNDLVAELRNTNTGSSAHIGTNNNGIVLGNSAGIHTFYVESSGSVRAPHWSGSGNVLLGADNDGRAIKLNLGTGLEWVGNTINATGTGSSGALSGSGTAGYIPVWSGSTALSVSPLSVSSGNVHNSGYYTTNAGYFSPTTASYLIPSTNGYDIQSNTSNSRLRLKSSGGTMRGAVGANSTQIGFLNSSENFVLYSDQSGNSQSVGNFTAGGTISASNYSGTHSGNSSGNNTGDQDLSGYAPLASPNLTGSPTAPTQPLNDNSMKIATTAYVDRLFSMTGSGVYTPSVVASSGITYTDFKPNIYTVVDSVLDVQGAVILTTSSSGSPTLATINISLPSGITPDFITAYDASGHGTPIEFTDVKGMHIKADPTNNNIQLSFMYQNSLTIEYRYSFKADISNYEFL